MGLERPSNIPLHNMNKGTAYFLNSVINIYQVHRLFEKYRCTGAEDRFFDISVGA